MGTIMKITAICMTALLTVVACDRASPIVDVKLPKPQTVGVAPAKDTVRVPCEESAISAFIVKVDSNSAIKSKELARIIVEESRRNGVDPKLTAIVMAHENPKFDSKVVTSSQDHGLMQINASPVNLPYVKSTAKEMGIKNFSVKKLQDPRVNIRIGTSFLSRLVIRNRGNINMALASYNGWINGEQGYRSYLNTGKPNRYSRYVEKVLSFKQYL